MFSCTGGGQPTPSTPATSPAPSTPVNQAVRADYGDAPDGGPTGYPAPFAQTGQFKTRLANNGAHTLNVAEATLGASASLESDTTDPADPDGVPNLTNADSDNAQVKLDMTLVSIPPPAKLRVQTAGQKGGAFFINALIDLNMDGKWGGMASGKEPEWVVKNFPVTVPANSAPAWTEIPTAFAFANGNFLPDGAYMRIALTKESIKNADWDGAGEFSSGEIEDMIVRLPTENQKKMPILVVEPQNPDNFNIPVFGIDPPTYTYNFNGAAVKVVNVMVRNIRPGVGGTFTWTVQRLSGGVLVAPPGGAPLGIGPAPAFQIIALTANKGLPLPSQWLFTVQAIDPESVMVAGDVMVGFAEPPPVVLSFIDDAKAWISGNFAMAISVSKDPAGHLEFINMPKNLVAAVSVVGDPTITISGTGAWVPVSGEVKPDGSFEATGKGTVAGYPNVSVIFKGTWTEYAGFSGEYTMGAGGELPGRQSITYQVEAKRQ